MNPQDSNRLGNKNRRVIEPLPRAQVAPMRSADFNNPAVNLIRQKLEKMYTQEPSAEEELAEAEVNRHPSKHQKFLLELTNSGKSLVEIQTGWHDYYASIPDEEKHEVWQEFYELHEQTSQHHKKTHQEHHPEHKQKSQSQVDHSTESNPTPTDTLHISEHKLEATQTQEQINITEIKSDALVKRSVKDVKEKILGTVHAQANIKTTKKLSKLQHLKSLGFGLAFGGIFILVMLFGLFNERFLTPFITPSRKVSATPIIIDPNGSQKVDQAPKVIIPAINVEAPVIYDLGTNEESAIQTSLEKGTYHYITTPKPGEKGNVVVFGHSSNNILNSGQYKFVFLALNKLSVGDQFILNYNGTRYVYKIFNKRVVDANDVGVLNESPKPNMATLITCDPPGTSLKRLLIEGEQISPSTESNTVSTIQTVKTTEPITLPGNAPSLWSRITGWFR